ncbi:MAG: divergent PAP2 family protein [Spirochaetia bacterium]|nr:divergent PAP2 family protein [Spirochaetia bacterium]
MDNNLLTNAPFLSAFFACIIAQFVKPIISVIVGDKFDIKRAFSTGGMPSSHTATVIALTTTIALRYGIGSTLFAISAVFGTIVIHDAMGIRKEAGKQAELLNEWSRIFIEIHEEGQFTQANLKTMLGHSFSQVFFGAILGLIVGIYGAFTF